MLGYNKGCKRREIHQQMFTVDGDVELAAEQGDSYNDLAVGTCEAT